ncbi:MAG TPA: polysaccharide biosynthesis/export family protein [Verrucomicrobiae bacterium]|nr:polysaccharide biosynthesis/export family protein [Verrucomicrobiae bacterium]
MSKYSLNSVAQDGERGVGAGWKLPHLAMLAVPVLALLAAGCQTQNSSRSDAAAMSKAAQYAQIDMETKTNQDLIVLREGDTVNISFPGAPDLNTSAVIRRDGRITLKSLGEFKAAGLTPPAMEKELLKQFGSQLQTKEVSVAVQSAAFPVYVTGAVLRPGKVTSDRPMTALEAVMEAGGFDYTKANTKAVRVLRIQNGHTEHYNLNLKRVLQGEESQQFSLQPGDIVYVPEKFNFF